MAVALSAPAAAAPPKPPGKIKAIGIAQGHALLRRAVATAEPAPATALISIIIDDLGEQQAAGQRTIELPGAVACSFLPHTRHGAAQAARAHARGKEILLHLPLQPGQAAHAYPTGITLATGRAELAAYLRSALASVPHVRGVNNHQGSLLTEMPQPMDWLMAELKAYPQLYFVDSRTSGASVAYRMARARAVPAAERSVFLDTERGEAAVRAAFRELLARAQRDERALAIGHPYPETLQVLEEELPRLARYGVRLVPPSELIAHQNGQRPYKPLKLNPALTLAARTTGPGPTAARSAAAH